MEAMQQERPPAYTNTDPDSLVLPAVPTHELPPHTTNNGNISLPDIKSLGLPTGRPAPLNLQHSSWGSPPQHGFSYHNLSAAHPSSTMPPPSPMETDSVVSEGRRFRAPSIMSLDDPETREAAETLSGLRNMDVKRASSTQSTTPSNHASLRQEDTQMLSPTLSAEETPEPLLSLIASTHPWIEGTISASIYAYNSTMQRSPQFVQNIVARQVSGVESVVGTVGRITGADVRLRNYLEPSGSRATQTVLPVGNKRPRSASPVDLEKGLASPPSRQRSRTGSQVSFAETLPAYDENRSPPYEASSSRLAVQHPRQTWKSKLVITTSGLGVALSETSLNSLKYCLSLLRNATNHLTTVMATLRQLIEEFERIVYPNSQQNHPGSSVQLTPDQEAKSHEIAQRIKSLGQDIMGTIKAVTTNVSKYTGSALPENAGALVRRQLLSVPLRWRVAEERTANEPRNPETLQTGQKWFIFAEQGCDMIGQVSIVLQGTVDSAESWLESMGRKKSGITAQEDQKTGGSGHSSPRTFTGGSKSDNPVLTRADLAGLRMTEKK